VGVKTSTSLKIKNLAAVATVLATAALLAGAPAGASAAPIKLGVYDASQGQVGAPEDASVLDSYAQMVGRKPDIVMDYSNITDPLLTKTEVSNLSARGETPLVTWQLFKSGWGGSTIPLSEIAAGKYDSYLRSAATAAKGMPFGEILIRFAHEMNGDWYGWSGDPSNYVAAWRHVVTVFRQEGANNVKFVWAPNVDNGSYPFAAYFPGDSYVDYVGLDGYNWGTAGVGVNKWQTLSQVFSSSYQQLTQMSSRPVMITETSSSEIGGSKAAWIREGFLKTIPQQFPRVAAVIWFDRNQEEDWRIDSSQSSLAAYREVVASTLYGGTVPPSSEPEAKVEELEVTPTTTTNPTTPTTSPTTTSPETTTSPTTTTSPETTTSPTTSPTETTTTTNTKKKHHRASVRGRVLYRLSSRASVRLELRGPRIRKSANFSVTVAHPKLRGRVRLSSLTGGRPLPRGHYHVVATAIDNAGSASHPRRAPFRVVPKHAAASLHARRR
jgi:Glycosyl hydrolase family 26